MIISATGVLNMSSNSCGIGFNNPFHLIDGKGGAGNSPGMPRNRPMALALKQGCPCNGRSGQRPPNEADS